MGVDGIGRDMGRALVAALLIAFLGGASCAGIAYAAWRYNPFVLKVERK